MGNFGSRTNDQNPNNNGIDPLTDNPQYQAAYRNLYGSTSDMPNYPGVEASDELRGLRAQGRSSAPKIEVKTTFAIQNDFFIEKDSVRLVDIHQANQYYLTFKFNAKTDVAITIYFHCKEILGTENNTEYIYVDENLPPVESFIFGAGANQEFPAMKSIVNTTLYPISKLTSYGERIPLIIKMETASSTYSTGPIKKFYSYCSFTYTKTQFNGRVLKQKLEVGGKSFILDDIFGLSNSNLKDPNAPEAKECAICLTSKIDTLVLPCKHMCLCFDCAQDLRGKSNKCPLCREVIESFVKLEKGARSS